MVTDISLVNNVIQITEDYGGTSPSVRTYVKPAARYFFNSTGLIFNILLWPTMDSYNAIPIADLRVGGVAPANAAAALTALSSVFQK